MVATINNPHNYRMREYNAAECAVFLKTREKYGGLSNMAGGYLLEVNGISILSSEALYQACRFPHLPEIQRLIIEQKSPMSAKMKSKPYRNDTRPDWESEEVRMKVMRWCLQVKLAQNWESFSELLLTTGDRDIVEHSKRDDFWGAKPISAHIFAGANVLGRLLKQLRSELVDAIKRQELSMMMAVAPLPIDNFLLYGDPIGEVNALTRKRFGVSTELQQQLSTVQENAASYVLEPESCGVPESINEDPYQPLLPFNTVTCSELENLEPINGKSASTVPGKKHSKPVLDSELVSSLEDFGWDEIESFLASPKCTKRQIAELGFRRFGISRSKLEKLNKQDARYSVHAALENEKTLDLISQAAREAGKARLSWSQ